MVKSVMSSSLFSSSGLIKTNFVVFLLMVIDFCSLIFLFFRRHKTYKKKSRRYENIIQN